MHTSKHSDVGAFCRVSLVVPLETLSNSCDLLLCILNFCETVIPRMGSIISKLFLKGPCDSISHVYFVHCLVFQLKHCARFEVLTVVVLKIQVLWLCQRFVW
jgi:hypothetical protein